MPARHMPLIGIPTCLRRVNERTIHGVNDKYPTAVIDSTGCLPILIPAVGSKVDICGLLDRLDGLLLTGSPSNVHPSQYGGEPSHPETLHDPGDLPRHSGVECRARWYVASAGARGSRPAQSSLPERFARRTIRPVSQRGTDPGRTSGIACRYGGNYGQFVALPGYRSPSPQASHRSAGARRSDRGGEPARSAICGRRTMAPRAQGPRKPVLERPVFSIRSSLRCIPCGCPPYCTRGLIDSGLVPARSMRFCRFGYARIDVCFLSRAPHLHQSEAERVNQLSLERPRLPYGSDFPQTLLTCRRPVFPPDRAPLCLVVPVPACHEPMTAQG